MKDILHFHGRFGTLVALLGVALLAGLPTRGVLADDGSGMKKPSTAKLDDKAAKGDEFSFDNSVIFSGAGAFVNGSTAEFMQRHGMDKGFSGGVEDFRWKTSAGKDTTLTIDGHGLFDNHDYLFNIELARPDLGYVKTGYKEFRTWYNGGGGFWPGNGQYFQLYGEQLALDRRNAWFEAALTLPDVPVLKFRYDHEVREGQKDSTIWGATMLTGNVGTTAVGQRNIVPSFRGINESRDIFAGELSHTIDKTKIEVAVDYEQVYNNDTLNIRQNPYEGTDRYITQREIYSADEFSTHATTETWFSDKFLFATAGSFSTLDSDLGGSRIYGTDYNSVFARRWLPAAARDAAFIERAGGSKEKEYVASVNALVIPFADLSLAAALRAEQLDEEGRDSYLANSYGATTATFTEVFQEGRSQRNQLSVAQSLEARYTGLRDWVITASGEFEQADGTKTDDLIAWSTTVKNGNTVTHIDVDNQAFNQKYLLGASWYPSRFVNATVQYYRKIHENSYVNRNDSNPTAYAGYLDFQNFTTDNVATRVTARPLNNLTFVTRYDYQLANIDTKGETAGWEQSGQTRTHRFGESMTWNAMPSLYFQTSVNYVLNRTDSQADNINGWVQVSRNNYWTTTFVTGWAATQKTDINLEYTYYRADDFYGMDASLPLGAGAEEHSLMLSAAYRVCNNVRWALKYGVSTNQDDLYGSHHDYFAHMVYSSIQVGF